MVVFGSQTEGQISPRLGVLIMLDKIIEMTLDGRLSIVWAFVIACAVACVCEVWSSRRGGNRRVSGGQRLRKYWFPSYPITRRARTGPEGVRRACMPHFA